MPMPPADSEAVLKAFMEFVSSPNWPRSFDVLESRQAVLFPLGARLLLIQLVADPDDKELRQRFALHLTLLEIAAHDGIGAARRLVDQAVDQGGHDQRNAASDADMLSTVTTSIGYSNPAQSQPNAAGASGGNSLESILAHLSPEERRQVEQQLRGAQGQ